MTIGARKSKSTSAAIEEQVTGSWDDGSGDVAVEEFEQVDTQQPQAPKIKKAEFVRMVTMVGRYPAGSILPAAAFESLDRLLELGAVEYDFDASAEFIAGNPEHVALLASSQSLAPQTIPHAPWINSSPANLLGAKYVPIGRTVQSVVQLKPEPKIEAKPEPKAESPKDVTLDDPFPDTTG